MFFLNASIIDGPLKNKHFTSLVPNNNRNSTNTGSSIILKPPSSNLSLFSNKLNDLSSDLINKNSENLLCYEYTDDTQKNKTTPRSLSLPLFIPS